jgi:hypothetical protein
MGVDVACSYGDLGHALLGVLNDILNHPCTKSTT